MSTTKYLDPEGMLKLVHGYLKKAGPTFQLKSTSKYLELSAKNIEAAIHAHDHGMKYAVHSTQFPTSSSSPWVSLPSSTSCTPRSSTCSAMTTRRYIDLADEMGFPCYNCSYYRCFYAMIEAGAWPKPDMICYSSSPCDQTPKGQEGAGSRHGCPSFGLDRPTSFLLRRLRPTGRKSTRG